MIFLFFSLIIIFHSQIKPQSIGFGCLGLVGGYGGISYQEYQPGLLKNYVDEFNINQTKELKDFGKSEGYRFGIHFFRAKFSGFFITTKGFYQQLDESHQAQTSQESLGITDFRYDLRFKSFGLGLDIGIPIFSRLLWKILDGAVLVNTVKLTETANSTSGTRVRKFDNDKPEIGYSIGSGFVLDIIKNYISLEGIVGYTFFKIEEMKTENNIKFEELLINPIKHKPFIKSGGINATVQLNIGFPL
ncbi:MAG: hypothetical protein NZM09_03280 [Ignavibacterium sp.]|nr:hypothetical protein [Ignavibacterium sp.]MDW8374701.1 hypothetical protein [Ignavibacteriales bacterium]